MKSQTKMRLLAEILTGMVDDGRGDALSEDRIRTALTVGPPLTPDERRLLWVAPIARSRLFRVRECLRSETESEWRQIGARLHLVAQVAASSEASTLTAKGDDFAVTLYRDDVEGMPWTISLNLSERLRRTLDPASIVVLADSGGLEWLCGRPDRRGEIHDGWFNTEMSPVERLARHSLSLSLR